jgi:hypothetical protein
MKDSTESYTTIISFLAPSRCVVVPWTQEGASTSDVKRDL